MQTYLGNSTVNLSEKGYYELERGHLRVVRMVVRSCSRLPAEGDIRCGCNSTCSTRSYKNMKYGITKLAWGNCNIICCCNPPQSDDVKTWETMMNRLVMNEPNKPNCIVHFNKPNTCITACFIIRFCAEINHTCIWFYTRIFSSPSTIFGGHFEFLKSITPRIN